MPRIKSIPAYTLHKPTGRARVRIAGQDHYLGTYGSAESREEYARLIAETFRPGGAPPTPRLASGFPDLSINELFVKYLAFAEAYYVKDGVPTGETENMKNAMRAVRTLYENTRATEFGPLRLKAVRQHMIDIEKLARGVINSRINRIRRIFKWAVSEELIPASVFEALHAVEGLRYGRCNARETTPVRPVDEAVVQLTLHYLPPVLADMVTLQRLTSMRPGNVVGIRWTDIDRGQDVWVYRPPEHKTRHRDRDLAIPLGPRAQQILLRYQHRPVQLPIFSPQEVEAWRREQRRLHRDRKTKIFPCETKRLERERLARSRRKRRRAPGAAYTPNTYAGAIRYALQKAKKKGIHIPAWHPNQLRHLRATEVRKEFGLEGAQVVLGHAKADVTQIYAERDLARAVEIARATG